MNQIAGEYTKEELEEEKTTELRMYIRGMISGLKIRRGGDVLVITEQILYHMDAKRDGGYRQKVILGCILPELDGSQTNVAGNIRSQADAVSVKIDEAMG